MEREVVAVSDVENVGSILRTWLYKSEELVSDEASVLLGASVEIGNSDEFPTLVESKTSNELAVNVTGLGVDEEVIMSLLWSHHWWTRLEPVELRAFEIAVVSELPEAVEMVPLSSDTPVESLSLMSLDTQHPSWK
jgi:hypothetical protein